MKAKHAASGVGVAAAAVVASRYLRDLRRARARLAAARAPVDGDAVRAVSSTASGAKVRRSCSSTVSSAAATCRPHGGRSCRRVIGSSHPRVSATSVRHSPMNRPRAAQADAFVCLFDALGIAQAPVLAFSAGTTSAVQLALRHPDRVSALVLVASNSPHEKPVTLAPRALAPLVFSEPTLWFLRVFLPSKLAAIAGKPAGFELSEEDLRTLETIFDSFFPLGPRRAGCDLRRLRRQPRDRQTAPSRRSPCRRSACTPPTTRSPPTTTRARWSRAFPARAGCASSAAVTSSSTTTRSDARDRGVPCRARSIALACSPGGSRACARAVIKEVRHVVALADRFLPRPPRHCLLVP